MHFQSSAAVAAVVSRIFFSWGRSASYVPFPAVVLRWDGSKNLWKRIVNEKIFVHTDIKFEYWVNTYFNWSLSVLVWASCLRTNWTILPYAENLYRESVHNGWNDYPCILLKKKFHICMESPLLCGICKIPKKDFCEQCKKGSFVDC